MNETCERIEEQISAWMDDELERPEAVEMLDHLSRCAQCRGYYRQARALEGLVVAASSARPAVIAPVSAELWSEIEQRGRARRGRWPGSWALRAAALAVVGLALAFAVAPRVDLSSGRTAGPAEAAEIEVELGSKSGEMTEGRFLEIATEVLEADQRYQRAMFQVMDRVVRDRVGTEGGEDRMIERAEGERVSEDSGGRA